MNYGIIIFPQPFGYDLGTTPTRAVTESFENTACTINQAYQSMQFWFSLFSKFLGDQVLL